VTAILLALAASISYGAADFTGGIMTRRSAPLVVVLLSQLAGLVLLLVLTPILGWHDFSALDVEFGVAGGIVGGVGVMLLYRGLATGRMSIVAPVTALEAAAVPVVFGLLIGERPSAVALMGITLGFVAVGLVSWSSDHPDGRQRGLSQPGLLDAFGAGLAFGVFFILLSRAGHGNALWALAGVKVGSITIAALCLLMFRQALHVARRTFWLIAVAGFFDMGANVLYLLATRSGLLSLVAVLTSMYPATTVLLARFVLNEKLERIQLSGLTLATLAIIMIARG
jgi:drug/metabolite transporter (DMT)-like permease